MYDDTTEQVVEPAIADDNAAPEVEQETEQQQEADAEAAAAVNDADESSEPPKPKGVQKRIDELTRNWREAERREAALLAMLQQQKAPAQEQEPVVVEKPKALPKLEDFNYDEAAYQAALIKHAAEEAKREALAEIKREREQEAKQQRVQTFKQRQDEFATSKPDFWDKVRNPSLEFSADMYELCLESEKGPELIYELANNPELSSKIARMGAVQAAREIGRLEAKLDRPAPPPPPKPQVSKAPPPPPRIEAAEAAPPVRTTDASGDVLSDDEWVKAERKRLSRKR